MSAQQAAPGEPQATHIPLLHATPALLHVLPQQAEPKSPHLVQMPFAHWVPGAVHEPAVPQHGNPAAPHDPHAPALQVPPPMVTQVPPSAMQMPATQQPPEPHAFPLQQG